MKKNVFVVFTENASGNEKEEEKLRMALGMTLNDDNAVNLIFLGDARSALKGDGGQTATKHLSMLSRLKASFYVESDGDLEFLADIKPEEIDKSKVDSLLDRADIVVH